MRFICKKTHNHFIKGKEYIGIELSDGVGVPTILLTTKDTFGFDKRWYYPIDRLKGCDCIKDWFWTLEEWRENKLKEIGIV
jgi:hypothetical protein